MQGKIQYTSILRLILLLLTATGLTVVPARGKLQCPVRSDTRPIVQFCPASNDNYRAANRGAADISYIVIHTVQGPLSSAIHTFSSDSLSSPRSAHFTIGKDGTVIQSVSIGDIAWHAGTSQQGSGQQHESSVLNRNSIGIEHEGYVSEDSFPTHQQYLTSAALVRLLCSLYQIPIDRDHIVGHDEIKSTKGDPGENWDWSLFMDLVRNGYRDEVSNKVRATVKPSEEEADFSLLSLLIMVGGGLTAILALLAGSY
ncbi:MAG: N-acetylmuramoyl-L-alanine amidase [Candidatus Bipolaricaulota bacterium]